MRSTSSLLSALALCWAQSDVQRAFLIASYNSTNGPFWSNKAGWLVDSNHCNWANVKCDENKMVTDLNSSNNKLQGVIPDNIGDLGPGFLRIYFDSNSSSGPIPASITQSTGLSWLGSEFNQSNGTIPEFNTSSNLFVVRVHVNKLTGGLPESICLPPNSNSINVNDNQSTGPLPSCIGNITGLNFLEVQNNQFSGSIPPNSKQSTQLKTLIFAGSSLDGPVDFSGFMPQLLVLELGSGHLYGPSPSTIGVLTLIPTLSMANQEINGSIPSSICDMTALTLINLSGNKLTGSLPTCMDRLVNLYRIELQGNQLTGSSPSTISSCPSSSGLVLFNNRMSGPLPTNLGSSVKSTELQSQDNQFNGSSPNSIVNMKKSEIAYFATNRLTGPIPISNTTSLTLLEVQNNQFTGDLPDLSGCTSLSRFFYDNNMISGIIPHWVTKVQYVSGVNTWTRGIDMNANEPVSWSVTCLFDSNYFPCPIQPQLRSNGCSANWECSDTSLPQSFTLSSTSDFAFNSGKIGAQQLSTVTVTLTAGVYPAASFNSPNSTLTLVTPQGVTFSGISNSNVKSLIMKGPISFINIGGDSILSTFATNVDIGSLSITGSNVNKGINLPNARKIALNSITANGNRITNAVVSVGGTVDTMTMTSCVIQSNGGVGVSVAATLINQSTFSGTTISNQSTAISSSSTNISSISLTDSQAKSNTNGAVRITANMIDSITITNGNISSNSVANGDGAGSYVSATSVGQVNIESTTMSGNRGNNGAAVCIYSTSIGTVSTSDSRFANNIANNGGAFSLNSLDTTGSIRLNVKGSSFFSNQARSNGGAIHSQANKDASKISFTSDGCTFDQNKAQQSGGAIYASSSLGTLDSFNFLSTDSTNNAAVRGGAVSSTSFGLISTLNMAGGVATNNYATSGPGGIFSVDTNGLASVTISDVTYANNYGTLGGAVRLASQAKIQQMSVMGATGQNNSATQGGFIYISCQDTVSSNITSSEFNYNNGTEYGGSIYVLSKNGGTVSSVSTNYDSNTGGYGGAVYIDSYMDVQMSGGSFTNNRATRGGSICGASVKSSSVEKEATFQNNVGREGGAVYAKTTNTGQEGAITVTGAHFKSNAAEIGGAMSLMGGDQALVAPLTQRKRDATINVIVMTQCVSENNNASVGGGLALYGQSKLATVSFSGGSSPSGSAFALLGSSVASVEDIKFESGDSIYSSNGTHLVASSIVGMNINCTKGQLQFEKGLVFCPEDGSPSPTSSSTIAPSPEATSAPASSGGGVPGWVIAIIVVVVFVVLAGLVVGVILFMKNKKERKRRDEESTFMESTNLAGNNVIHYRDSEDMVQVGRGAFGVVYRADWREIVVAVKQILNMSTIDEAQLEEFTREVALSQGSKHHPNVVMFIGISVTPDPISLVTEFCSGGNLLDFCIKNKKDIPVATKLKFILGIASGMHHSHHENIIHRDLAARNVLLSNSLEPKISDFGSSRKTESADDASMTTSNVGPSKWMAPEAIVRKEYSAKSDVFSFAMTVWEILSDGDESYPGLSPVNAAIAVTTQGERPVVRKEMEDSAPRIVSIMKMCWETEPEKRPTFKGICRWLKEDVPSTQPVEVVEEDRRDDDMPVYGAINVTQNMRQSFPRGAHKPEIREEEQVAPKKGASEESEVEIASDE